MQRELQGPEGGNLLSRLCNGAAGIWMLKGPNFYYPQDRFGIGPDVKQVVARAPSCLRITPSFKVSLGQVALAGFGVGLGVGFDLGVGVGLSHVPQPLTMVKKRRLRARKRTSEALLFEAIFM
ncbi:hypothetical protein Tco_1438469 [Tanacetum coccineum]